MTVATMKDTFDLGIDLTLGIANMANKHCVRICVCFPKRLEKMAVFARNVDNTRRRAIGTERE